jgi:predicted solute-binding protein
MPEETPKLRMAAPQPMEEAVQRVEREQRAALRQRESGLEDSLAPFRVGSVGYLNAVPLTRGLEEEVTFDTPANLARQLEAGQLDAALVSVVEPLFTGKFDILDSIAIASLGEVKSVILAHRGPLEQVREVACDTASLTSVELLRVLLAERGLHPEFRPLASYEPGTRADYTLLIGDRALDCNLGPHEGFEIWDLGQAWYELTGLPFVYAAWALRRDLDTTRLRRLLREARDFGLDTLDHIIRDGTQYTQEFRQDYLGWHIHYHLGTDEKRGLAKFIELLRKHSRRPVFEPKYVL